MNLNFSDLAPPKIPISIPSPIVTIIIPTLNCAQIITHTLDSILNQSYTNYEILVIDGGSSDRTLEILRGYYPFVLLYSVSSYDVYSIINQGIALAKGQYINILFPGDSYMYPKVLEQMMELAVERNSPDLMYSGTLLHDGCSEAKFMFRQLSLDLLKKGQQPTSLQACWFKKELFTKLGPFRTDFHMRGGFDFLCRFFLDGTLRFFGWRRSFVHFDLRGVTSAMVIKHFWETGKTINQYFGRWALVRWAIRQKDVKRFILLWLRRLQSSLIERR